MGLDHWSSTFKPLNQPGHEGLRTAVMIKIRDSA